MLAIISGKGGTGKTTISIALSRILGLPLVGADVESPTTMIAYRDEVVRREPVMRKIPKIVEDKCTACGVCAQVCPFGAILMLNKAYIDETVCEGCLLCVDKCPVGAIEIEEEEVGEIRYGRKVLLEGALKVTKKESRYVLEELLKRIPKDAIVDGAPGASPLVYRIARKADKLIVVVEPNKPSVADATRILNLLGRMKKPAAIIINKHGLGNDELVEDLARRFGVPIIARVKFYRELLTKSVEEVEGIFKDLEGIDLKFSVPKTFEPPLEELPEPPKAGRVSWHISVVSGKGGTGKTLLSIGLSRYLGIPVVDADVDAPDSYVLLGDVDRKRGIMGTVYEIDPDRCTSCGACLEACYNYSIEPGKPYRISAELCEGCGMCVDSCPVDAIRPRRYPFGRIGKGLGFYIGESIIGRAGIGDLVYELKRAVSKDLEKFVLDGSPGSGCTAIASISNSQAVVIVVEPKPESLSSAKRVSKIAETFGIKRFVVINKRLGEDVDVSEIGEVIGYIPFDEEVFASYAEGRRPEGSKADEEIRKIALALSQRLGLANREER